MDASCRRLSPIAIRVSKGTPEGMIVWGAVASSLAAREL
jgi:hypothetical protein